MFDGFLEQKSKMYRSCYNMWRFLVFYFHIFTFIESTISQSATEYGPFDVAIKGFVPCMGPKPYNCANTSAVILNDHKVLYDVNVTETMKPTKAKVVATSNNKELVRLQLDNPCKHLFVRPMLVKILNATQNCLIMKGRYNLALDMAKIVSSYYAGSFFYGDITFKTVFFNNKCNLSCAFVNVIFTPKGNVTNKHAT